MYDAVGHIGPPSLESTAAFPAALVNSILARMRVTDKGLLPCRQCRKAVMRRIGRSQSPAFLMGLL